MGSSAEQEVSLRKTRKRWMIATIAHVYALVGFGISDVMFENDKLGNVAGFMSVPLAVCGIGWIATAMIIDM